MSDENLKNDFAGKLKSKTIKEYEQDLQKALENYQKSSKDKKAIKKLIKERNKVFMKLLPNHWMNLSYSDFKEKTIEIKEKFPKKSKDNKETTSVLDEIEIIIKEFISKELKDHLENKEVKFDGYILVFTVIENEEKENDLISILKPFYSYPLFFEFQKYKFQDTELNPKIFIEIGLNFNECIFGNLVCKQLSFKKKLYFYKCNFRGKADFSNAKFQQTADFSNAEFQQKSNFYHAQFHQLANFFNTQFGQEPNFAYTKFQQKVDFNRAKFQQKSNFYKSEFYEEANFHKTKFQQFANFYGAKFGEKTNQSSSLELKGGISKDVERSKNQKEIHPLSLSGSINETNLDHSKQSFIANFSESEFKETARFSEVRFYYDANFKHATFKHISFTRSHFYQIANFYCAKSSGVFDFSFSIFHQQRFSNFVGVNPLCSFERLEEYLREKNQENEKEQDQKEKMLDSPLDIRDSFRNIKEILTVQTNTLDAQNWHVMELYAKELELKIEDEKQPEKQNKPSSEGSNDGQDLKKGDRSNYWRRKIDQIQLWFYRSISDHHTDLLKIIGHVLSVIGLFGVLLFACRYGMDLEKFFNNHPENVLFVCMKSIPNLILKFLLLVLYCLMIVIWLFKIIRFVLEIFPSQFLWIYLIVSLIVGLVFVSLVFVDCWGLNVWLFCYSAIVIFTGCMILLLSRIVLRKKPSIVMHRVGVFVSSLIALVIISVNPKYILGVGSLFGEKIQGVMENFIVVAYSIIMLLLLFSLQKTARKNSIFHG